jgi:hypothetical protein
MSMDRYGGMSLTGKAEELREKPVPVPLCPPQITYGLIQVQTQGLHAKRMVTNCLSQGMVQYEVFSPQNCNWIMFLSFLS